MFLKWLSAVTQITSKIITKSSVHEEVWIMPLFGVVIDWCESNFLIFQCCASTNTNNLLSAIVCNFRAFVGHFISSIWLRFGIKSSFRVLITKWILKSSSYFCLAKKRESALGLHLPANMTDRKWSFKCNSSPIVNISQALVLSVKRDSLPLNINLQRNRKYLVLTIYDPNIQMSLQAALNREKFTPT